MNHEEAIKELSKRRGQIDEIDVRLLELLNQRTRVVEEIGRIKDEQNLPIYEPKREDDVFRNVLQHNEGPLTEDALKGIFERIIDEMRTVQRIRRQQKTEGAK
jgi:chorismate mutase